MLLRLKLQDQQGASLAMSLGAPQTAVCALPKGKNLSRASLVSHSCGTQRWKPCWPQRVWTPQPQTPNARMYKSSDHSLAPGGNRERWWLPDSPRRAPAGPNVLATNTPSKLLGLSHPRLGHSGSAWALEPMVSPSKPFRSPRT